MSVDPPVSTDVGLAVERLRSGGLVAIPTETVYGLAADAEDPDAVARIFEVKQRPRDHPLIVHLADASMLTDWARDPSPAAITLAEAAWPGPLTLLVRRSSRVGDHVTGGRDTVGLRVPAHPLTAELLERFGGGLAAPSANLFGNVSPTTAAHVVRDLGGRLDPRRDLVLDGGPSAVGVESTIVDCVADPPQVLRPGGVPTEDVEALLGDLAEPSGPSRASGMLASHYAPACRVVPAPSLADAMVAVEAMTVDGVRADVLDHGDDLVGFARDLYADLRAADDRGLAVLVVVLPPEHGLGHAIRDRILKAAAPRGRGAPSRDR